ncbi:hypothetical protein M9H77_31933 [Catharanthus roseus]|uniref:Uncharacterized protein n=1 Tax=Catharanthus roseus TaxID=4058 RepID=A0ACC0A1W1_CATRO|nr:hypothetical protein M9H77_31933 [Catharanthus roseus]
MKPVLVQNKIAPAICSPKEYPESWRDIILAEKIGDAHSCLTLHLTDNVLEEINEKDNAFEIWTKLEKLYLDLQKKNKSNEENLYVRGRVDRREPLSHRPKSKERSKSREKNKVKYFYCGKEGHMKNKCFKRIKDKK